jgi:protein gp37
VSASGIEWTQVTWNFVTGCDTFSPGCDLCYARVMARRLNAMGQPKYQTDGRPPTSGPGFGVALHPDVLGEPFRWRTPRLCFVCSMSDLFHAHVPRDFIAQGFGVMARTPQHTYQVLTKRTRRMRRFLEQDAFGSLVRQHAADWEVGTPLQAGLTALPLPNVWLGTSIELDKYAARADELRRTPAAVRFLSCEPLLGPLPSLDLTGIGWVIVGGESGQGARPMRAEWALDLQARCDTADVPLFFKQPGTVLAREWGLTGKGGKNPEAWPIPFPRQMPDVQKPA